MEDLITERINLLVKERADKPSDFAKATGLTSQNVYDLTTGRKGAPSYASLKKILIAFPDVSERWLLLGEGEMLKSEPPKEKNVQDSGTPKKPAIDKAGLFPAEAPLPTDAPTTPANTTELHGQIIQTRLTGNLGTPKPAPEQMPVIQFIEAVASHGTQIEQLRRDLDALRERVEGS